MIAFKKFLAIVLKIQGARGKIQDARLIRQKYIYELMRNEKEFLTEYSKSRDSKKAMKIMKQLSRLFREGLVGDPTPSPPPDAQSQKEGKELSAEDWSSLLV